MDGAAGVLHKGIYNTPDPGPAERANPSFTTVQQLYTRGTFAATATERQGAAGSEVRHAAR
jgi:hypothetical protein